MPQQGRAAFAYIKDLLSYSSQLVIMNEGDPLILYTGASKKAIGGVLMQVQNSIELRTGHALGYRGVGTLCIRT